MKGLRKPGQFCWINLLTPDPERARAFFADVLGWSYSEIPGVGHTIKVGARDIGGLFDLASPQTPPGTAPQIGVMVKVESADAAAAKVASLGGKTLAPFDVGDSGRLAVCFDPNGANIDLWQPRGLPGTDIDSDAAGAPRWFETLTSDLERASEFYAGLFGWKPVESSVPGSRYVVFVQGGEPVAGAMQITPKMGAVASQWKTYFNVRDVEATILEALELGAELALGARDIPGGGKIAGLTSPQGVPFFIGQ